MDASGVWQLFMETGAPEYYLMYRALKTEDSHVSENQRVGASGSAI